MPPPPDRVASPAPASGARPSHANFSGTPLKQRKSMRERLDLRCFRGHRGDFIAQPRGGLAARSGAVRGRVRAGRPPPARIGLSDRSLDRARSPQWPLGRPGEPSIVRVSKPESHVSCFAGQAALRIPRQIASRTDPALRRLGPRGRVRRCWAVGTAPRGPRGQGPPAPPGRRASAFGGCCKQGQGQGAGGHGRASVGGLQVSKVTSDAFR